MLTSTIIISLTILGNYASGASTTRGFVDDVADFLTGGTDTTTDAPYTTDTTTTDTPYTTDTISGGFTVVLPNNNCGYTDVQFNNSLNGNLGDNDTIWFYETLLPSNCGPQDSELGCVSQMFMTGPYSELGFVPYTVWYYFTNIGSTTLVNLYYNYNNSATHLVGSVPCDNVKDYMMTLSPCMFSETLYSYEFFTQYKFNFYLSCSQDSDNNINFNLDQESLTCIGGVDENGECNVAKNLFNLVNFDNWYLDNAYVDNGAGSEFCPPPPEPTPTPTETETPTHTETPTETPTVAPCKSCQGNNIVITISNTNTNVNTDIVS